MLAMQLNRHTGLARLLALLLSLTTACGPLAQSKSTQTSRLAGADDEGDAGDDDDDQEQTSERLSAEIKDLEQQLQVGADSVVDGPLLTPTLRGAAHTNSAW